MLKKIVLASLVGVTLSACGSVGDAIREAQNAQNERYTQAQINDYYNNTSIYLPGITYNGQKINIGTHAHPINSGDGYYNIDSGKMRLIQNSYSAYGYVEQGTNQQLVFMAGIPTIVMPTGTAHYNGSAVSRGQEDYRVSIDVDFNRHVLDGRISNSSNYINLENNSNPNTGSDKDSQFVGPAYAKSGAVGHYEIHAFGPSAQEIAGIVKFSTKQDQVNNVSFGASR